jgi:hypothetical protein
MVNVEILEGLKAGLERGQSLKRVMMSFFNAGYSRSEIEEAAGAFSQVSIREEIPSQQEIKLPEKKKSFFGKQKPVQPQLSVPKFQTIQNQKTIAPVSIQNVSNYETSQKSDKLIIIILVSVLVFLFGILATVFFFKDEIMSLFGG